MKTIDIQLGSIEVVKEFVDEISRFDADFDLLSGRYVVDAKSILGILSLDLAKPLSLQIYADEGEIEEILSAISAYIKQ